MQIFDNIRQVNVPPLDDNQFYIYVIENYPQGNIKIGRSTNVQQRLYSLSGSNTGGNRINKIAISEPTYLYTMEQTLQTHFDKARIKGTEWFDGSKITFNDVVLFSEELFNNIGYSICNKTRKQYNDKFGPQKKLSNS